MEPYLDPLDTQPPDFDVLERSISEGACEAIDGCLVDPDGVCKHGCPSWLLYWGLL